MGERGDYLHMTAPSQPIALRFSRDFFWGGDLTHDETARGADLCVGKRKKKEKRQEPAPEIPPEGDGGLSGGFVCRRDFRCVFVGVGSRG